jgi:hypothetical protein
MDFGDAAQASYHTWNLRRGRARGQLRILGMRRRDDDAVVRVLARDAGELAAAESAWILEALERDPAGLPATSPACAAECSRRRQGAVLAPQVLHAGGPAFTRCTSRSTDPR